MDIIITSSTQEVIRQNKSQMRFLDKLVLKQNFDLQLIINMITCSMLQYPSTSDYDDMENGVSKSTLLQPTINHLMKEKSIGRQAAHNLVIIGGNIRA